MNPAYQTKSAFVPSIGQQTAYPAEQVMESDVARQVTALSNTLGDLEVQISLLAERLWPITAPANMSAEPAGAMACAQDGARTELGAMLYGHAVKAQGMAEQVRSLISRLGV